MDYEKLTKDLIKAREAAQKAVKGEDGGTANFDCMTLALKGTREERVIQAVEAAGLRTFGKTQWIGVRYFINPPIGAQGNDRCRQVKEMCRVMQELEYDVLEFEKAD